MRWVSLTRETEDIGVRVMEDSTWGFWFAWFPVTCGAQTVWLEKVERRQVLQVRYEEERGWPFTVREYVWEYR